ncbi:hypothetical protein CRUP_022464, partial [Coryphaenoides rupestris]
IRARVKEVRTRGLELTAAVEVKEVLKSSLVNIPRETHTLFYTSSCPCPPLTPGKDYIILGYENEERSRLLLIEGSVAQKWKDRIGKKVKTSAARQTGVVNRMQDFKLRSKVLAGSTPGGVEVQDPVIWTR